MKNYVTIIVFQFTGSLKFIHNVQGKSKEISLKFSCNLIIERFSIQVS